MEVVRAFSSAGYTMQLGSTRVWFGRVCETVNAVRHAGWAEGGGSAPRASCPLFHLPSADGAARPWRRTTVSANGVCQPPRGAVRYGLHAVPAWRACSQLLHGIPGHLPGGIYTKLETRFTERCGAVNLQLPFS